MSLGITVGALAGWLRISDEELVESVRNDLHEVNRVLTANHLPAHVEPESLPALQPRNRLDPMPYWWFDSLRRAVAYSRQAPEEFPATVEDENLAEDPHLDTELTLLRSH